MGLPIYIQNPRLQSSPGGVREIRLHDPAHFGGKCSFSAEGRLAKAKLFVDRVAIAAVTIGLLRGAGLVIFHLCIDGPDIIFTSMSLQYIFNCLHRGQHRMVLVVVLVHAVPANQK